MRDSASIAAMSQISMSPIRVQVEDGFYWISFQIAKVPDKFNLGLKRDKREKVTRELRVDCETDVEKTCSQRQALCAIAILYLQRRATPRVARPLVVIVTD